MNQAICWKTSIQILLLIALSYLLVPGVAATEVESGSFQVTSTGTSTEFLDFSPDYVEFITAQQVESAKVEKNVDTNNDCPQNVNGWSEGSALFDDNLVDKQFTIGAFRNSDSTNDHRVASSTSDVIKNVYTDRNGEVCGELRISVVQPTSYGFQYDVEARYGQFDEIVRYKAYQFPDNMEFNAGLAKISSDGAKKVSTGFQPANVHIRAGQQIESKNTDTQFQDNDPDEDNTLGRSKGYATLDSEGKVIDQQSIGTASSSDSTNAHRSIASDDYILNTAYVGQDGNLLDSTEPSRLRAKVTGAESDGFSLEVDDKWSDTDDIFLYRAWGFSYYDYQVGYKAVDSEGSKTFITGFEPDAIDIYAEQQIDTINQEVVTPTNDGCANAGGWTNGYYEADDNRQWALSTGRTSDSQNSHRIGHTNNFALNNLYSGQNGDDCGDLQGEVTSTSNNGFEMDFTFDSEFDNNYDEEMVYYRAFDFLLTPPTTDTVDIYNKSLGHSFGVNATIEEGANNIDECEITVEGLNPDEGIENYDAQVDQKNSTHSYCSYEWINYDDNQEWEDAHHNSNILPKVNVTINASGSDDFFSETEYTKKFPNNPPIADSIDFFNYSQRHAFNTSALLEDVDSENDHEIESCEMIFTDGDGNSVNLDDLNLKYSKGNGNQSGCPYSNINSSETNFETMDEIDLKLNVTDHHGASTTNSSSNTIPNDAPYSYEPTPRDGGTVTEFPVDVSFRLGDNQDDDINVTVYNSSGGMLHEETDLSNGDLVDFSWNVPNAVEKQYTWIVETRDRWSEKNMTYKFTKIIGRQYRSDLDVDLNYSSIVLNAGDSRLAELTITNNVENDKNLTVNLTGIQSEFLDGDTQKTFPNFEGQSSRSYRLRINPDESTDENLDVVVRNNDLGIETVETITVSTLSNTGEANEVPGIGLMQVVFLAIVSTVLYSVRL